MGTTSITGVGNCYPFHDRYRIEADSTAATQIALYPAKTIITGVLALVNSSGAGAANMSIGDSTDASGYIVACDHTSAAGTIFGDAPSERGAYLYDSTVKGGYWKVLASAAAMKMILTADPSIASTWDIFVTGFTY